MRLLNWTRDSDMDNITSRPRTLKEMANFYHVSIKTFKQWMKCDTLKDVRPVNGYYYSIASVKAIVQHLGEP